MLDCEKCREDFLFRFGGVGITKMRFFQVVAVCLGFYPAVSDSLDIWRGRDDDPVGTIMVDLLLVPIVTFSLLWLFRALFHCPHEKDMRKAVTCLAAGILLAIWGIGYAPNALWNLQRDRTSARESRAQLTRLLAICERQVNAPKSDKTTMTRKEESQAGVRSRR